MATPTKLFEPAIVRGAAASAFGKLDPRIQARNPVMFVVLVGSVLVTLRFLVNLVTAAGRAGSRSPARSRSGCGSRCCSPTSPRPWPRGAARPRPTRCAGPGGTPPPGGCAADGATEVVPASALRAGDLVVVEAGEVIPGDGEVIEGVASVDESAITGESAPVIREAGGDRSAVTGGTRVLSDRIGVRITAEPGQTFLDRMIALVEGAARQKTPNEIALSILLGLHLIFLIATVTL